MILNINNIRFINYLIKLFRLIITNLSNLTFRLIIINFLR